MVIGGKGTNPKTTLYVGGLEESVNEAILHSAFIPFGDIKDVNIPMDHATGKHRGFGFVEFEGKEVRCLHFWRAWHGKQETFGSAAGRLRLRTQQSFGLARLFTWRRACCAGRCRRN